MKVYQYKYNEIFIIESFQHEDGEVDAYNEIFDELLLARNISDKKIYQSFNLLNNKISSETRIVKALLTKDILPVFTFLICKN